MTADMVAALAVSAIASTIAVGAIGLAAWMKKERDASRAAERDAQLALMTASVTAADKTVELYERILERKKDDTASIIESAVRLATTGSAAPPSALVQTPEPDAEQILRSRVVEETITNGMRRLREEYERAGVQVPDDETLREEVEIMLGGGVPESATAGMIRS